MGLITDNITAGLEWFGTFSEQTLGLEPALAAPSLAVVIAAVITGYYTDYENLSSTLEFNYKDVVLTVIIFGFVTSVYFTSPNPARMFSDAIVIALLLPLIVVLISRITGVKFGV